MKANKLIASFRYNDVTVVLWYRRSSAMVDPAPMYYELTVWDLNTMIDQKEVNGLDGFKDEVFRRFNLRIN